MQNAVWKFSISEPGQVLISPQDITFCTTDQRYRWNSIRIIKQYFTIWNALELQSNLDIIFDNGDCFQINEFNTGSVVYDLTIKGLVDYLPGFDKNKAEDLAMCDFNKKKENTKNIRYFN